MPGEQHVMTGREATEDVILDHVVGFVFEEQIAFVLINVQPQRANFLVLQGIDGRLGVDQRAAAGVNHHHSVLHLIECPAIEQMVVFVGQRAVQGDHVRLLVQRGEVDIFYPQL